MLLDRGLFWSWSWFWLTMEEERMACIESWVSAILFCLPDPLRDSRRGCLRPFGFGYLDCASILEYSDGFIEYIST